MRSKIRFFGREGELRPDKECFDYEDDYQYAEERHNKMLDIVNQLWEEYLKEYSKDYGWRESRKYIQEHYFNRIIELSEKYNYPCENIALDFNWVFGLIEKIEKQLTEKDNNGWILCKKRLPVVGDHRDVWITLEDGVYAAEWNMTYFEWENGRAVSEPVIAWKPRVMPEPYQPGGE